MLFRHIFIYVDYTVDGAIYNIGNGIVNKRIWIWYLTKKKIHMQVYTVKQKWQSINRLYASLGGKTE